MSNTEDTLISNYYPDEELLNTLDTLRQNISDGKYSKNTQTEILESIESYVTGKGVELDPDIVKILVQGWWVQDAMEQIKTELKPTEPTVCPLCLQEKIETEIEKRDKTREEKVI
jgi:hypothetical protein